MSRTAAHGHLARALAVAAAGLVTLTGCGSGSTPKTTAPPAGQTIASVRPQTPMPPPPSPTESAQRQGTFSVYFYATLSKDRLAPVPRPAGSPAVLGDALHALSAGPSQSEQAAGVTTQFPRGVGVREIEIKHGVATIELTSHATGLTGLTDAALAQLVFTATQFPTVKTVEVELDGHHAVAPHRPATGTGGDDHEALSRADFEEWSPAVLLEAPVMGTTIHNPARIRGTANTYEATFRIQITDADGRIIASQTVMATSGSGTRGTFDVTIPYAASRNGSGEIVTSVESAKDGSRIVISETPVAIAP